jgi:hypothetical protein
MKKLTLGLLPLLALVVACGEGDGTAARQLPPVIQTPGPSGPNGEVKPPQQAIAPGEEPGGNGTGGGNNGTGGTPGTGGSVGGTDCNAVCASIEAPGDPACLAECASTCPAPTTACDSCICSGAGIAACTASCS